MDTLENENVIPEPAQSPAAESPANNADSNTYWSTPGNPGQESFRQPQASEQPQQYAPQSPYARPASQYQAQVPPAGYYPPHYAQPAPPQPPQSGYYSYSYRQPQPGYTPPAPPKAPPTATVTPPVPPRPTHTPKVAKKKHHLWRTILAAVLVLALVGGSCFGTIVYVNGYWRQKTDEMTADFDSRLADLQNEVNALYGEIGRLDVPGASGSSGSGSNTPVSTPAHTGSAMTPAQVYQQNVQSVVAISSTIKTTVYGIPTTGTATGSGFIYTSDGYIVTNYHVIDGASAITVTTNNGFTYGATLVGGDENNDVAVLKVEATDLPCVTIGSSDSLVVGDQVAAIGNPLGTLTNTLTVGYVSAKDRAVTTDSFAVNMLQTDAAINSGNSGGPLFNMYGEVVGITSAKYSGESSSGATIEGIGFAIPIDDVKDLIEALINDGYVSSGYLGVSVGDYVCDSSYASYYGIPESTPAGGIIREVVEGYSADRAGVQLNDVIVGLGDYTVTGVTSLSAALRHYHAGDTTTITVYRNGEKLELTITLDEQP